jgi:peptide/nickel transport system substrate-binding protein
VIRGAGPWGTGPYKLVEGFSTPEKRSDRVVLEANTSYWDKSRSPRIRRIVFDNTLSQKDAVELVKSGEGRVDLVSELSPLEGLEVAQSPFAQVVKNRGALRTVFGQFNSRKPQSPWNDVRLRRAANLAIDRADLIRYAAKGNGMIVPAMLAPQAFGYDPKLVPYSFDPAQTRSLLREAGYPDGLTITLLAPEHLSIQATVVSKMLEQGGFKVTQEFLAPSAFNRKTTLGLLDQPAEQQSWDIALTQQGDPANFPLLNVYHQQLVGGPYDWGGEKPDLRSLYEQVVRTVDPQRQRELLQQMERQSHDQAYKLFLYQATLLYAANKNVDFVPYATAFFMLHETSVTDQHWSVRKGHTKK